MKYSIIVSGSGGALGAAVIERFKDSAWEVHGLTTSDSSNQHIHIHSIKSPDTQKPLPKHELSKVVGNINFHSPLRVIVNCIGGNVSKDECPMRILPTLADQLRLNLEIPIEIIEELYPVLEKPGAVICNIASISGVESHGHPGYSASKAALIAYTRSVGRYMSAKGVSMFCVSPGAFHGGGGSYWDKLRVENLNRYEGFVKNRLSVEEMCTAQDVASFVYGLISNAHAYMSGNNYIFDGGQGRAFQG